MRTRVTYTGGAISVRSLVHDLEAEGCTVEWTPPEERRDLAGAAEAVVVGLVVNGTGAAIVAAVKKFRARVPRARVEVEDAVDDGDA